MAKVVGGMTISLDGFVNDRNGDVSRLYPNLEELRTTEFLQTSIEQTGAVVMGRASYEMAQGDFTDYEYQVPIFVVTHQPPAKVVSGTNEKLSLTFVSDGVESAVAQAKEAAGDKEVTVIGGASIIQQCLQAGLLDELNIGIMPVLLGEGLRLFENPATTQPELEKVRIIESPGGRTDIIFRVIR